jgi:hypothetical protein
MHRDFPPHKSAAFYRRTIHPPRQPISSNTAASFGANLLSTSDLRSALDASSRFRLTPAARQLAALFFYEGLSTWR